MAAGSAAFGASTAMGAAAHTMMAGESGRSHTGTVHCYYKCGTRKRSGKEVCSLKPVRKEPLEQFVVQTALEKVLNDRVIDLLADKLLEYQSKENTRLPVLQAELKEVKRRIDNLVAAIEQGILTPATKARMEELEQQREELETSVLQEQIETPPITREQILFWFDQFCYGDPAVSKCFCHVQRQLPPRRSVRVKSSPPRRRRRQAPSTPFLSWLFRRAGWLLASYRGLLRFQS